MLSLSRILNEELKLAAEEHIRVGTIMPWGVDTPWWTHAANYTGHAPRIIHEPVDDGLRIDGGIRERMRQEDAGAHH